MVKPVQPSLYALLKKYLLTNCFANLDGYGIRDNIMLSFISSVPQTERPKGKKYYLEGIH